ncbi:MAG: helix-turn-helix transcriptional regulator [Clostridia bacterium]|nr:helix-turn-helix transcriptional regulator [Clostridia bacterium]MBQ9132831.1 helix-turn-helix transcriptional regulator [Clostridia bacterium]
MRTKLVKLREGRGYSQETFSKAVGISRSHYSQIETGDKAPSLKLALAIKRVLDYSGDDIFFDHRGRETGQK